MDTSKITIAVDGYSACGKSTLAKDIASQLKLNYIDTGAMYRGVTLFAIRNNWISEEGVINLEKLIEKLPEINIDFQWNKELGRAALFLNEEDVEQEIRMPHVAKWVSKVAAIKEVRYAMVDLQRKMGMNGGVILDGRDVGSVVFPYANIKLFVVADPKIRARRRLKEMQENGFEASFDQVLENLQQRDEMDLSREEGPLIQTDDAIVLDTTELTREEQVEIVKKIILNKK